MSRCDYDGIFYRVFCVTLLAIAFTFTVILTNVFIDIDGILSKKDHRRTEKPKEAVTLTESVRNNEVVFQGEQIEIQTEVVFHGEDSISSKMYDRQADISGLVLDREDDDGNSRTKRSLDTPKFQYHVGHMHPKIKEILNNKLAVLLEELDAEETHATKVKNAEEAQKVTENQSEKHNDAEKPKVVKPEDDLLHLAMHNILLQGIIGHMDLNDVYKKVHELLNNIDNSGKRSAGEIANVATSNVDNSAIGKLFKEKFQKQFSHEVMNPESPFSVETKFFEELIKCKQLQKQLEAAAEAKIITRRSASQNIDKKDTFISAPKMLIRTVIDIKTLKNQNDSKPYINSNNIKGLIKLIYNGKPIQFSPMKENEIIEGDQITTSTPEPKVEIETLSDDNIEEDSGNIVDNYINSALSNYLKTYPTLKRKFENKRLKRHTKLGKIDPPEKSAKKNEDEELYVEIETHFDSKGIKGNKKKKVIQQIVDKIRKAIHSQMESMDKMKKVKKETVMQIRKRLQNPLKPKATNDLLNKIIIPIDKVVLRESEPISKIVPLQEQMPLVSNSFGENIGNIYHRSGFLSDAKSINSGEMGSVTLDYDKVFEENGIPQRIQKPLNTDNVNDQSNYDSLINLGDLKFYVKEFDGAGFSIGFNQYVAEAPDPESMKLFTGLQQLIYNADKKYDDDKNYNNDQKEGQENTNSVENIEIKHELRKRDARELNSQNNNGVNDYHYNEYKVIFDNNYQPYDSYSQIFEDVNKKVSVSIVKDTSDPKHSSVKTEPLLPLVIDGNLFTQQLTPSEIFSLANLLDRKKRSIKVKMYSNVSTRTKLNRYLNTIKMASFNKKRRNKRQVDKIRIIASDSLPRTSRRTDDENVFIVSDDENMFADRAVVRNQERERETEDTEQDTDPEDHHEIEIPTNVPIYEDHFNPYNMFATRARQNSLMSKYPHVFLDEISQSKEETSNSFYNKLLNGYADAKNQDTQNLPYVMPSPGDQMSVGLGEMNLDDAIIKKPNYKLTVKIIPKNSSDDPGFKEIHTSINKSVHKNGLLYSSQVNMTELSKVENLNPPMFQNNDMIPVNNIGIGIPIGQINDTHTNNMLNTLPGTSKSYIPLVNHIKEQQERMKLLLKKHKQRIDDQLNTLKQEKLNLDSVIVPYEKKVETIDVILPLNPPQMLHLNKDEAGQLISKALMKLHNSPQLNDIMINNLTLQNQTEDVPEVTTAPPRTIPRSNTLPDPEKERILSTIQRNENLTSTILYKIDRNTDLLQSFLQKISESMVPFAPHTYPVPEQKPVKGPYPESLYNQRPRVRDPFFGQTMPNLEMRKNATHVSIPFVYAYQQPYPLTSKPNAPIASVVYQGHIHTNAYNNANNLDVNKPITENRDMNITRFFMDDNSDNLYKIIPAPTAKKSYDISRTKNNITQSFSA